jgi:glutamine synthetase
MLRDTVAIVTEGELDARYHVMCEKYTKDMVIEAKTMLQLTRQTIIPAVFKYRRDLSAGVAALLSVSSENAVIPEMRSISLLGQLAEKLEKCLNSLVIEISKVESIEESSKAAKAAVNLAEKLNESRKFADEIEDILADEYYPLPKYTEILFN